MLPKWRFAWRKNEIEEHRESLKEIQQGFMFMKPALPSSSQAGSLGVQTNPIPITLTGTGKDMNGDTVAYSATLVTQPKPKSTTTTTTCSSHNDPVLRRKEAEVQYKSRKESEDLDLEASRELTSLRESPYFSKYLLERPNDRKSRVHHSKVLREESDSTASLQIPTEHDAARDVDQLMDRVCFPWSQWIFPKADT